MESLVDKYPDNKELGELRERAAGIETVTHSRTRLAVICLPGLESFLGEIVNHAKAAHEVRTCYSANKQELEAALQASRSFPGLPGGG